MNSGGLQIFDTKYGLYTKLKFFKSVKVVCCLCCVLARMRKKTTKNAVFWDVAPYGFIINLRFGSTCRLHLQGRRNNMPEDEGDTFL
jgi:hypothetical protein